MLGPEGLSGCTFCEFNKSTHKIALEWGLDGGNPCLLLVCTTDGPNMAPGHWPEPHSEQLQFMGEGVLETGGCLITG